MVKKRLQFAMKLCKGELPLKANFGINFSNLEIIIDALLYSIDTGDDIKEFIDNISGGNVRLALNVINNFFGSGHVNTKKIVDIHSKSHNYKIPVHELLQAVIYGDYKYYSPERSPIANLFDISRPDPKEHFVLPLLLGLLTPTSGLHMEEGFVKTSDIYARMQAGSFLAEQIDDALVRAYRKKLIETVARKSPELAKKMPEGLRITMIGMYHITRLCRDFSYMNAIMVDTPILDDGFDITDFSSKDILDRVESTYKFAEYLNNQYSNVLNCGSSFHWSATYRDLKFDINRSKAKAIRRLNNRFQE